MKRLVILLLACSAVALSFSAIASAQRGEPTIALHIDATKKADRCIPATEGIEANEDCSLIKTNEETLGSYFVYILVGSHGLNGIGGAAVSINYDAGITVHQWTKCAPQEFAGPTWPDSGTDNAITWGSGDDCSVNQLNVAGFFEMTAYSAGTMWVGPRVVNDVMDVTDCDIVTIVLDSTKDAGQVSFGTSIGGCNPCIEECGEVPTFETTWGKLKNLYSEQ